MQTSPVITFEDFWRVWQSHSKKEFFDLYSRLNSQGTLVSLLERFPKAEIKFKWVRPQSNPKFVVVIPTSGEERENSRKTAEYFAPFPVLFVVSSGPYFSYSRSSNLGIEEALKKEPTWVVLCNDDMTFVDPADELARHLDRNEFSVCTATSMRSKSYHGESRTISKPNFFGLFFLVAELLVTRDFLSIWALTNRNLRRNLYQVTLDNSMLARVKTKFSKITAIRFVNFSDFGVFKADFIKNYRFDEHFINGYEDYEMCARFLRDGVKVETIPFKVESQGGVSLSAQQGTRRFLRDQINRFYLTLKLIDEGIK